MKHMPYIEKELRSGGLTAIVIHFDKESGDFHVNATDTHTGETIAKMIPNDGVGWFAYSNNIDDALGYMASCVDLNDVEMEHKKEFDLDKKYHERPDR